MTTWRFLKKLNIKLPYDPAIPLLGMYPKKTKTVIQKDICAPMFTAALFTVVKTWKQPWCPSTYEWIKKLWYMYTMEYYSAINKSEAMPLTATWRDLKSVITKGSKSEKDTYCMVSLTYGIKKIQQISE